ncbi:unnamed protein product [Linum trigynum]|uniref:Uncharacterized protein n=1 Tax=Linum trigynum TaxID=586398 RepID=A0AAV2DWB2_9ROSI
MLSSAKNECKTWPDDQHELEHGHVGTHVLCLMLSSTWHEIGGVTGAHGLEHGRVPGCVDLNMFCEHGMFLSVLMLMWSRNMAMLVLLTTFPSVINSSLTLQLRFDSVSSLDSSQS